MNILLDLIDQTWNLMQEMLASTSLQMFLLVGSGLLAICLLILAMTRFGHSRPVWKCVVLSVGAHILLLGYAYGTRMVYVAPTTQPRIAEVDNEQLEINLIEESQQQEDTEQRIEAEGESWNQFVNQQPLPELEKLGRPEVDSQIVIDRQRGPIQFDRTESAIERNEPLPKQTGEPLNQLGASQLLPRFQRNGQFLERHRRRRSGMRCSAIWKIRTSRR